MAKIFEKKISSIFLILIIFFTTFKYGSAVICYDCNSEFDPRCADPFDDYSIGRINCSLQPRLEHLSPDLEPVLCRKTLQITYGKKRVVRGCGYIEDEKADNKQCLMRSGTHDVKAFYCSCTTDLCNSSFTSAPSISLLGISCAGIILFFRRRL